MPKHLSVFALIGLVLLTVAATACGGNESVDDNADVSSIDDVATSTATIVPTVSTTIPTATGLPVPTVKPTAIPAATATPAPTVIPTATTVPTAVPTVPPTSIVVPTVTPTVASPTPVPTATPIDYSIFTGTGFVETETFDSPPRLPWLIEWVAEGVGANSITVTLMDPESRTELIELVSDTGIGQSAALILSLEIWVPFI